METVGVPAVLATIPLLRRIGFGFRCAVAAAATVFGIALWEGVFNGRWPWDLVSSDATAILFLCTLGAFAGFVCGVLGGSPAAQVPLKRRLMIGLECGARVSASWIGAGFVVVVALLCFMLLVEASDGTLLDGANVVLRRLATTPLPIGVFPLLLLLVAGTFLGGGLALLFYGPAVGRYGLAVVGACTLTYISSGVNVRAAKEAGLPVAMSLPVVALACVVGAAIGNSITKRMLSGHTK